MQIKTKLTLALAVAIIVPTVILASYSIYEARSSAVSHFQDSSAREIKQVNRAFNISFDDMRKNVDYLSSQSIFRGDLSGTPSFLTDPTKYTGPDGLTGEAKAGYSVMKSFAETHPGTAYIYVGTSDGRYLEWPGKSVMTKPYDPRVRPWYKKGINSEKGALTSAYYWEYDDATYISMAKTLKDMQGKKIGVLGMDISVKQLTQIVQNIKIGQQGHMLLIEDNNNILVDPIDPDNTFKKITEVNNPIYKKLAEDDTNDLVFETTYKGKSYLVQQIISKELGWRFVAMVPSHEVFAAANRQIRMTLMVSIPIIIIFLLIGIYVATMITRPLNQVTHALEQISSGQGDLTVQLAIRTNDEVGRLSVAFNGFVKKLRDIISEVVVLSQRLNSISDMTTNKAKVWHEDSRDQLDKITLVTEAIGEMSKATSEIASSAESAAHVAENGAESGREGQSVVEQTSDSIKALADEVNDTTHIINQLSDNTQQINTILTTIQSIAEQTNLLALNAAIEAARAGEHGRGFAVVADEVRNLSHKTAMSTEEIQQMITGLQQISTKAVDVMQRSQTMAGSTVEQANQAKKSIADIMSAIDHIKGASTQIATATEEQTFVCNDVTQNTGQINDIAARMAEEADSQLSNATELRNLSKNIYDLVGKFKV